jgi:hypothetical protein
MSAELEPVGQAAEDSADIVTTIATYAVLLPLLAAAGLRLAWLSDTVRSTYRYVERCAAGTDRLAEQMASLSVDAATVGEHHDAAAVMRAVLEAAEQMAVELDELSTAFHATRAAHEAEYGPVADAAACMPVPMADAQLYSNR